MFRHRIGSRKKSTQASQYRVGRYGLTEPAAFRVTSTWLVTSAASAPRAAPRDESVTVDRNSAIAPTPSMDTPMNAIAPAVLTRMSAGVRVVPDIVAAAALAARFELVTPPGVTATGCTPNSSRPVTYEVPATATTAVIVYTMTEMSLATSSRVRPTGRASRYRSIPEPASPAMASPATTATATGRKIGSTMASAAAGYSDPLDSTADSSAGPWPGGGARWVTATKIATMAGSPHSSAMLTQLLGRRASLISSIPI